jgi:sterol desaturase/sphingolipid hydroxylase (fatty acid hydroxylase superfamily)
MNDSALRFGAFAGMLVVMALAEVVAPRRALAQSRARRWTVNLALVAISSGVIRVVAPIGLTGVAVAVQAFGWGLLPAMELASTPAAVIAFLALDLLIYLQHRVFHAVPLFWRLHQVHHTDQDMDATTGVRFHPLEMLLSFGLKALAVAALGAPVGAVLAFEVWLNATSLFNHANWRMPLLVDAVLRWVVVTPDMHRVHHSVRRAEQDANFGFNLPWWDRLCGTYRPAPVDGHLGMRVGLAHGPESRALAGLLQLPFDRAQPSTSDRSSR